MLHRRPDLACPLHHKANGLPYAAFADDKLVRERGLRMVPHFDLLPYRADFLRIITYGNAQKYLRIHFFFGLFLCRPLDTERELGFKRVAYSVDLNERRSRIGKKN